MRYLIHGATGRMGRMMLQTLADKRPETEICEVALDGTYTKLSDVPGKVDCIIDFSNHAATKELTAYAASVGAPLVIATTGHTDEELSAIHAAAEKIPVFLSYNYSIGIALLVSMARKAAQAMGDAEVEIVEIHHDKKLDVPSGTALTLAKAVQEVRPAANIVTGRHEYGKRTREEIGIHSLRMGNVVGVHEVHLCTPAQTLVLRHEAHDRSIFSEGALAAADFLMGKGAGLYGMTDMLEG